MIKITSELFDKDRMNDSIDIVSAHFGKYRVFTIRYYETDGSNYGYRSLGKGRFSLDFWKLGFIFENYRR